MDDQRYSRHDGLFGAEGQRLIARAKVAIVGLGGLGSHVAQQLAYLGVLDYVLVEGDLVTESSLNRLIGATADDIGASKVAVAERLISAVQPEATVNIVGAMLPADEALGLLEDRGWVFGCLDEDPPRLQLVDFTTRRGITYIDAASDVADGGAFGGRVLISNGKGCLFCLNELDQEELRRAQMSLEQRQAYDESYGITAEALAGTGPSVVSVNGVVASLAVNEFMFGATGITEQATFINYRADLRGVGERKVEPQPSCPYCSRWSAAES